MSVHHTNRAVGRQQHGLATVDLGQKVLNVAGYEVHNVEIYGLLCGEGQGFKYGGLQLFLVPPP